MENEFEVTVRQTLVKTASVFNAEIATRNNMKPTLSPLAVRATERATEPNTTAAPPNSKKNVAMTT